MSTTTSDKPPVSSSSTPPPGASSSLGELRERWTRLRGEEPAVRARDAAQRLGVTEAQLVACELGSGTVRLDDDFAALMRAMPSLGRIMALTRNDASVSEVKGTYRDVELFGAMGQVTRGPIDLRLFMRHFSSAFAVHTPTDKGVRRSLQIFDGHGTAIHKVFLEAEGDVAAFDALVAARRRAVQDEPLVLTPEPPPVAPRPEAEVDVAALTSGWDAMKDTHDFFHLLMRTNVPRLQALRLAGPQRAHQVGNRALTTVLEKARDAGWSIMIFVGSRGVLQVRSGQVVRVVPMGPWINVLDPEFNLHVRTDLIVQSWVVSKPTTAGTVCSLECYDARDELSIQLFIEREDRAEPEPASWPDFLASLPGTGQ